MTVSNAQKRLIIEAWEEEGDYITCPVCLQAWRNCPHTAVQADARLAQFRKELARAEGAPEGSQKDLAPVTITLGPDERRAVLEVLTDRVAALEAVVAARTQELAAIKKLLGRLEGD